MKRLWILMVFLLIPVVGAEVRINEIMYDPSGTDDQHEWVELYNDGAAANLSGWKLHESNVNHGMSLAQGSGIIESNGYWIIADDAAAFLLDYPSFNSTLFDSSFDLRNAEGEPLALKDTNGTVVHNVTYDVSLGGDGDGNSLQFIDGVWYASAPTPGTENEPDSAPPDQPDVPDEENGLSISVILESPLYIGFSYTKLFRIENLDHVSGQTYRINATVYYNISGVKEDAFDVIDLNSFKTANTGIFTPATAGNFTVCGKIISSTIENDPETDNTACGTVEVINPFTIPCNISIRVTSEKLIYEQGETIQFDNNLDNESFPFVIEYWVEDLFGTIFKKKVNTTNTDAKSYTPKIDEKDRVLLIKNRLYPFCNDASLEDNTAEKLVIVKNSQGTAAAALSAAAQDSSLKIEKLLDVGSDGKVKFGDAFRVNLNIYKGNTAKSAIAVWLEDPDGNKVGKESKANANTKYTEYDISVPIYLPPNCDEKLEEGRYTIKAEGLDEEDKEKIDVEGLTKTLCVQKGEKTETTQLAASEAKTAVSSVPAEQKVVEVPVMQPGLVYESTTQKAKNLVPAFLMVLTTLLSIVLLWRK